MAKHRIRALFEAYDAHQLGMCSKDQLLSVLTEVEIEETEALTVLGQLSQAHGSRVCYGEFLDLLFGEELEQEVEDEQHCGIEANTLQQAGGASLTKQVEQELEQEAKDEQHCSIEAHTLQQAGGATLTKQVEQEQEAEDEQHCSIEAHTLQQAGGATLTKQVEQEQEAEDEQHCSIEGCTLQQADGATLTKQVEQEACRQQEAGAQSDEAATDLKTMTLQQALDEREAEWDYRKRARRRSATVKSLPDLTEVPYGIDFHYDLLVMGQAAASLQVALGVQPELGPHIQDDTQPPISMICSVFAETPPDFSAERLETYLLSAECWGEATKAAKIQIRACHNSKEKVPTSDTRAEADAAAALFVLNLPSEEDTEAEPEAAQRSLAKQIASLKKLAGQYFEQRAPLLASLCCLLVFGEPPLPAQAAALAEKHSLPVVVLSPGIQLQPVMSRLASLLPAAAEVKEQHLAELAVQWEALGDSTKGRELATQSSGMPRRDQFGTCMFSTRDDAMSGQRRYLCKSAYEYEDDDTESWKSFDLSCTSSIASSRSASMNDQDVARAVSATKEAVEALRKAGSLQLEELATDLASSPTSCTILHSSDRM
eukprot:TRINITY_DN14560_c0_g1_i5.p1 TRINITY_DN14560_c0_g1~~TRINITY_DN14560_c0_g1_i5.p1  ORF type:complete len:599 (-),score=159.38 TRINITY_DN14560_c0_g1_i5:28-1824(-)